MKQALDSLTSSLVGALFFAPLVLAPFVLAGHGTAQAKKAATPTPRLDASVVEAFTWQSIGPANMSGRVIDLAVCASDPSTFWIATASGGLLKTVNAGTTFEHQFDHESTVSIGAIDVAASDPQIVWVGTGENNPRNSVSYGDGVYKSIDGGETWEHMGLAESFQTGDIVIHPSNPDVVYVGALGRLYGPNEQRGLYKTTDGGKSWSKIHYLDEHTGVIDIAMHPEDPDTLLIATYERQRDGFDTNDPAKKIAAGSGVYRTTDGGATFQKISVGLPSVPLGRIGFDWYAKDPNVVFAVLESELIGKPGKNVGWAGVASEDAETGAKITKLAPSGPAAEAGLEEGDIVIAVDGETVLSSKQFEAGIAAHEADDSVTIEVARNGESVCMTLLLTARPDPDAETAAPAAASGGVEVASTPPVKAVAPAPNGAAEPAVANKAPKIPRETLRNPFSQRLGGQASNLQDLQGPHGHEHGGLYRSDDGGLSWTRINTINPRPMYFSQVRVDPTDDSKLYVLGVSMSRSEDGGETFTSDAGRGVHSDQHALWIDPDDGRHMILGTDGGCYVSHDRCETWAHLNHAALGQFYHVAVGPRRDYWVYGGLQDNGTWGAPRRAARGSGPINEDWIRVGGGDGFVVQVDANDPDQIYYESQNGGTARTHLTTMQGGRIRPRAPKGVRYRFNWRTPFLLSSHNSRIYYNAGNHVFRSLDRGRDLKSISPDITRTDRGSATALAESPLDPDVLYVGSDDGAVYGTRDGGHEWIDLLGDAVVEPAAEPSSDDGPVPGGPRSAAETGDGDTLHALIPGPRWVSSIEASRFEKGRAYLTLDGHRSDDDAPHVFVTEDFGKSWRSLRANLPRGSTRVVREDLENPNLLYLGTEFGFWVSIDRGDSWIRFHNNLPTVAVHEVAQHAPSGEIVLATHGRSLWTLDVTALRQIDDRALAADAHLFEPNDVVIWQRRHRRGQSGGARSYSGSNPEGDASIYYRLAKSRSVTLTIQNQAGEVLRTLEANREKGLHRVDWNLRRDPTTAERQRFEEMARSRGWNSRGGARGQTVSPGTYVAVLEVGGERFEQSFEIQRDPGAPADAASRDEVEELERDAAEEPETDR